MSDDLHDMDDLFREGIEWHEEPVPSTVWDAVSNDLDKKQASYYKHKYNRLKRAALLLLLIGFVGGGFIVYQTSGRGKGNSISHPSTSSVTPAVPADEKKNGTAPIPDNSAPVNSGGQSERQVGPSTDTSFHSSPRATISIPAEKQDGAQHLSNRINTGTASKHLTGAGSMASRKSEAINNPVKAVGQADQLTAKATGKNNKTSNDKNITNKPVADRNINSMANRINTVPSSSIPSAPTSRYDFIPLTDKRYKGTSAPGTIAASGKNIVSPASTPSKIKSRSAQGFSLSAFASPNLNFDRLEDNDHLAGPGRDRQTARREEQENFSVSGGLLLTYGITSRWSVQSGVTLTSSSTSIAPSTVYAKPDNNGNARYELHCSSGYAYISPKGGASVNIGDSARTSGTVSKLTYVGIPVSVSYRIGAGRFSLYPSLGAGLNILVSGKTRTGLSDAAGTESTSASISGLKPTYVDGHFGLGIEYSLSQKISVGVRPNARIAITPINRETPVQSYQRFLSVETGIRIKL